MYEVGSKPIPLVNQRDFVAWLRLGFYYRFQLEISNKLIESGHATDVCAADRMQPRCYACCGSQRKTSELIPLQRSEYDLCVCNGRMLFPDITGVQSGMD